MEERLQNILSHRGVASRRAAATMIEEGRVAVDGLVVREPGARFDPATARISVDGQPLATARERTRTIVMYKPVGVLSSVSDPHGETVIDLLRKNGGMSERLVPVGRLDKDSEGLLLLSNDGDLTLKLTHPRYEHEKTYIVRAAGRWNEDKLRILRGPVTMPDGYVTRPVPVEVVREGRDNVHVLCFKLREGRKRQIRYMCSAAHLVVLSLKRVAVGAFRMPEDLAPGQWRDLSEAEIAQLSQYDDFKPVRSESPKKAFPMKRNKTESHPPTRHLTGRPKPNAFWSFLLAGTMALAAGAADVPFAAGNVEVVVAPSAVPTVRFAAQEATNFLAQVLGAAVPIVGTPSEGKTVLILGQNEWSAAAGLAPEKLARDAFVIKAQGRRVYVCGLDDPQQDPARGVMRGGVGLFERATLFGTYEFLHRAAGVRFYFPGEMGTYVPQKTSFTVPEGETSVSPAFSYRDCYIRGAGTYPGVATNVLAQYQAKELYKLRLRESTFKIPCCHGQNGFRIAERFSETHPEYFQLRKNGTRCTGTVFKHGYEGRQLCHTSPVWDIIRQETVERIRKGKKWVDVMPQDGMQACRCENCQRVFNTTNFTLASGYATELIWSNTVSVAKAITAAGLDGGVSQMAYGTYRNLPSIEIPNNVAVVLAVGGPWSESYPDIRDKQIDFVRGWAQKLGRKVAWIWTYPMKNYGRLQAPDVPQHAPRAYISFYKRAAPYIDGSFVESNQGEDSLIYNYLNYYVWSRFAWDNDVDVDEMLAEHHRLMFGAGAAEMTRFFDGLERKWIGEIAIPSLIGETEIGPWLVGPTEKALWTNIWGTEAIAEFAGYLNRAQAAVAAGSMEAKRIAWIRDNFFTPMATRQAAFAERVSVAAELARRAKRPNTVNLVSDRSKWKGARYVVDTNVCVTAEGALRLDLSGGNHYVGFSVKGQLKPNTRYRLSYFLKTENAKGRGVCMEYEEYTPKYTALHVPEVLVQGSEDWGHFAAEFTTSADAGTERDRSMIWLRAFKSTGTAWFDGMRLEEVQ
ncbi:MAG: pseudouridine synthase [Kiritimatiellae bacterium]|nr:pseudouridine synthase [Kiritimatiellia bacterium]